MIFNGKLKELFFKSSGLYQFAGAIFDKELRVTSRRRRYYVLRVAYLAILALLILSVWTAGLAFSNAGGSSVYIASRMPEVGKGVIVSIAWTQFILLQFLAVVLLSSSISDEIYHRTLGVLMTTPISSFHIVTGKLLSRLLQLLLLLGISFPILAIVRVFGGVPWGYVVSSLLVTLTSAIFTGSVSQLFSIFYRRAHEVILLTAFVCGILYAGPMIALEAYKYFYGPVHPGLSNTANHANPFFVMAVNTQEMFTAAGATSISLPLHLGIILAGIILWVGLCVIYVRRVGIRQATGDAGVLVSAKQKIVKRVKPSQGVSENTGKIRPVIGPPVIWKEIRGTFHKFRGLKNVLSFIIVTTVLIAGYLFCFANGYHRIGEVQTGLIMAYYFVLLLKIASVSATSITLEKESRTWPILLTTAIDDNQIVAGKIFGSVLRCWPLLLLLLGHIIFFTVIRCIHPAAVILMLPLAVSTSLLFASTGVLFSSMVKRSSTASILNLLLFLVVSFPVCCVPCIFISPVFQAAQILFPTCGAEAAGSSLAMLDYESFDYARGFGKLAAITLIMILVHGGIIIVSYVICRDGIRAKIFKGEK